MKAPAWRALLDPLDCRFFCVLHRKRRMPDYNPTNPASTIRGRLSIKRKHRSSLARLGSEQKSQTPHSLKFVLVLVRLDHVARRIVTGINGLKKRVWADLFVTLGFG